MSPALCGAVTNGDYRTPREGKYTGHLFMVSIECFKLDVAWGDQDRSVRKRRH